MATGGRIGGATADSKLPALEAIVLAAGSGARFGGAKLTAPWRGGVLLDGALAAAFQAPVRTVTVVTGADPEVGAAAKVFAAAKGQSARLRLVHARDHVRGMAASLRAAIASLPSDAGGAFVFLGDMPLVPAAVLPALADALARGAHAAAPSFEGRRGHPVLFARRLFDDLRALEGDEGAKTLLGRLGGRLVLVQASDRGVLLDVDFRETTNLAP